ncbi:hypothetical protein PQX77_006195 [Marasmius sp. AFHP31]|nr:hypothetical protein PQX77_006195 [Marasmius sp. AFHP31]
MASSPYFRTHLTNSNSGSGSGSVLPKLSTQGNLLSGAVARVAVGFMMNPFSVLKARFESNIYAYETVSGAFVSIVRLGPSELLKGFTATSLRDAPYAGLFVAFYEGFKRQAAIVVPPNSKGESTVIHSVSAAGAGALATMATHPFDVIKTKLQVRNEDRYRGFLRTVNTIWKVSVRRLLALAFFLIFSPFPLSLLSPAPPPAPRLRGILRRRFFTPIEESLEFRDWLGGV